MARFNAEQVIKILGIEMRADMADGGEDFNVACRIAINMIEEAQHYKDLAEQGRLLELPCKVGDTLYQIDKDRTRCSVHNEKFDESCCQGCEEWECDSKVIYFIHEITPGKIAFIIDFIAPRLGTEIFLTKSEAEQALERQV
jgi:hypothetical protein